MTSTEAGTSRFPGRLALIAPRERMRAFELAYSHDVRISSEARVSAGPRILLFEKKLTILKTDAIFLQMPYLRVTQGQLGGAAGRLKVYVDQILAAEGHLVEYLVDDAPGWLRMKIQSGQTPWNHHPNDLYDAVAFDVMGNARPDQRQGIFAAHSTVLRAVLEDFSAPEPVTLEAGIVAAYYTTRSLGVPASEIRSEY